MLEIKNTALKSFTMAPTSLLCMLHISPNHAHSPAQTLKVVNATTALKSQSQQVRQSTQRHSDIQPQEPEEKYIF